ncbi:MAG: hypothetical protein EAZ80_01560 [Runella slithyformis]|nr:MAG: hypothetical protein EAZ80_01560 [Runella slithyformis]
MKTLYINNNQYLLRQSWRECSEEIILDALPLVNFVQAENNAKKRAHFWVGLLRAVLKEVPDELFYKLSGVQMFNLRRHFKWLLETRIDFRPFEFFEFEGQRYILPRENFADTSAIELAMSNIYFLSFTNDKSPNEKAVLNLIATLCRPERPDLQAFRASANWNGDQRQEPNSVVADERAAHFERLNIGVVIAILQYFESMNAAFLGRYQSCFEAGDTNETPMYQNGEGWLALLEDVAETGVHGTFNQVCAENAHTVFLYIKHKTLKNKREAVAEAADDDDNT